jgi:lauroyl/myristoyl acyltransferase
METLKMKFCDYEKDIQNSMAYHYAEKIVYYNELPYLKELIKKITTDQNLLADIGKTTKNKNVIISTCHFGGVEILPLTLTLHGLPTAVFVNYKTNYAREVQASISIKLGGCVCEVGEKLSREIL